MPIEDGEAGSHYSPLVTAVVTRASVLIAVASCVVLVLAHGAAVDVPWAPTWGLRFSIEVDDLALLYGLLAGGVGVLVFTYATAYVQRQQVRLHAAMVLFLVSMIGLVVSRDLILLFIFWDLTAVASWLLIGFDRSSRNARLSALMALLVTTISAVLMLIGILLLRAEYGTVELDELFAVAQGETVAGALIAVAALAKSAQVPLHFWLPRAMAAPTPVSAYLHSAAMVAAGVFLITRIHPLLTDTVLDGLLVVGIASMAVGGVLALAADGLKRLLAYSTISQYGYVVTMLGIGGAVGITGASFYVLAHALAKSALFMTAGTVTKATGAKELPAVGGLLRRMPLLAAGSAAAAAALAALPLTLGFFKDELFFKAAVEHGPLVTACAVAAAGLTFSYITRFWTGIFLGRERGAVEPVARRLVWPVVVLGALVLVGGVLPGPFADLGGDATVAYHLDTRAENLMALGAYAIGLTLFAARARLLPLLRAVERAGERIGPEHLYSVTLVGLNRLSNRIHDIEIRDLRSRVAAVLVPGAALVALGVIVTPFDGAYRIGEIPAADLPLIIALAVCAMAAVVTTMPRRHMPLILALSGVGYALAVAYSLMGSADVALVAVLIETVFALLFVAVFAIVPREVLDEEARRTTKRNRKIRDISIATVSGVVMTLVVWGAFSRPIPENGMAERHIETVEQAHGKDVVTVILADFRGLDTAVEVTVVAAAMLGVLTLLRRRGSA